MDEWLSHLDALGLRPGAVIGKGVEGVVLRLGDEKLVTKVWHRRARDELAALQRFYAAVAMSGLPFRTPVIRDVVEVGSRFATVEDLLPGQPMSDAASSRTPVVTDLDAEAVTDVLAALASVDPAPDLAMLPALPGEGSLADEAGFGAALARLVERRVAGSVRVLRAALPEVDDLVAGVTSRLHGLTPSGSALVHGDLIGANILLDDVRRPVAVLDFGFLTCVGDPAFDAAVTASVLDMYGPHAQATETRLQASFERRLGHDPLLMDVYRAAYALATSTCFDPTGRDGHFTWCVDLLERPSVRAALRAG